MKGQRKKYIIATLITMLLFIFVATAILDINPVVNYIKYGDIVVWNNEKNPNQGEIEEIQEERELYSDVKLTYIDDKYNSFIVSEGEAYYLQFGTYLKDESLVGEEISDIYNSGNWKPNKKVYNTYEGDSRGLPKGAKYYKYIGDDNKIILKVENMVHPYWVFSKEDPQKSENLIIEKLMDKDIKSISLDMESLITFDIEKVDFTKYKYLFGKENYIVKPFNNLIVTEEWTSLLFTFEINGETEYICLNGWYDSLSERIVIQDAIRGVQYLFYNLDEEIENIVNQNGKLYEYMGDMTEEEYYNYVKSGKLAKRIANEKDALVETPDSENSEIEFSEKENVISFD